MKMIICFPCLLHTPNFLAADGIILSQNRVVILVVAILVIIFLVLKLIKNNLQKEEKSRVDQFTPLEDDVNRSKTDRDDSCNDHSTASGFFSFRKMVSRFLIQFIYVIGMIVITLSGLSYWKMALESNNERLAYTYFGLGLLILIGGNLVWRVISELLIVIFNIHNILASIEKKMG